MAKVSRPNTRSISNEEGRASGVAGQIFDIDDVTSEDKALALSNMNSSGHMFEYHQKSVH